jgi:hypothetical protein
VSRPPGQVCGFGSSGFDIRCCFHLWFLSSRLSGCCRFRFELLRPGRASGGRLFMLLGPLRDWLRKGITICGGEVVALKTRPHSD